MGGQVGTRWCMWVVVVVGHFGEHLRVVDSIEHAP